ncbi:phosphoribosyltransferase domain-containing protein, partial [Streptomyces nigra]
MVGVVVRRLGPGEPCLQQLVRGVLEKRAHLLVSNVLGKHVPQSPSVVHGAG